MAGKPLSRSLKLIADMHFAALKALSEAKGGQLRKSDLLAEIENRVELDEWARTTYETTGQVRWRSLFAFASVGLVKGGYVTKSRGVWTITEEGRAAVAGLFDGVAFIAEVHRRYANWKAAQTQSLHQTPVDATAMQDVEDQLEAPDERMARTLKSAHDALAAELIETIKQCDAAFFEKLVVALLLKMGYGGSRQEAGRAVGRSGDNGIDGIINEDRLGLDAIYLQAKRWEGSVGEGEIRDFKGALDAKGAHKGVFITTGRFTNSAIEAASKSRSYRIVLIDGARLADLMIEHDLGVAVTATYQLKRIDSDFFSED
ncbi:MAG: restriction endonuclease [Lysobacter sp.]|nr:MAG: restriction endonuclease [Lysobacter sp.]